jgi:hypothetical protein
MNQFLNFFIHLNEFYLIWEEMVSAEFVHFYLIIKTFNIFIEIILEHNFIKHQIEYQLKNQENQAIKDYLIFCFGYCLQTLKSSYLISLLEIFILVISDSCLLSYKYHIKSSSHMNTYSPFYLLLHSWFIYMWKLLFILFRFFILFMKT